MRIMAEGDQITLSFEDTERQVLQQLLEQLSQLLGAASTPGAREGDPALQKLLPIGAEDPEVEREFRTLTLESTIQTKRDDATRCLVALNETGGAPIVIDDDSALAWVRSVGAIRIVLFERMGELTDADTTSDDDVVQITELSEWLSYLQASLVELLSMDRGDVSDADASL